MTQSGAGWKNLNRLLRQRADEEPDRPLYTFLLEGETEAGHLTAAQLDRRARGIAAALRERCHPGDRALLLFPAGLDFIAAFFACLYAGLLAVPTYPPRPRRSQGRIAAIARSSRPAAVLTTTELLGTAGRLTAEIPELAPAVWLAADEIPPIGSGTGDAELDPGAETAAFLQYTSGSTSAPKGVIVTHGNLLHNQEMIQQAFGQDRESVVVGWLPLYHDMGLIGNVLQPLYCGGRCVLMAPMAFLQRPRRWLEAISRYRATTSGGPNFSYELCVQKIAPAERENLDLSSWRVAFNGAEPVRAETLSRFAEAFAGRGFRREAFYPCYGLAEATLFVAGPRRRAALAERLFVSASLEEHRAQPAALDARGTRRLVGCGAAWGGQRWVVVDPETGAQCSPGQVGEIWLAGPSVAAGYWEQPEETASNFGAMLADGEGPFLRTGDLGFLDGGELFITGRLKDLIVLRGRNHYPQDIELTVERSHPALRPGCGASFSVETDGEERLVVLQEVDRHAPELGAVAEAIRLAVAREHEVRIHEVVLLRAGGVLKTSSGKVQRRACRAAYLAGGLPVMARSVLTAATHVAAETGEPSFDAEALAALPPEERAAALLSLLHAEAARVLSLPRSRVGTSQPLTALGLDSLSAAELKQAIESRTGLPMALADLLRGVTLKEIATGLMSRSPTADAETDVPVPATPEGPYPLSYGQRALWFLQRWEPGNAAYNIAAAARTDSPLDAAALRRALEVLAARHAALRTAFGEDEGEPFQRLRESPAIDFRIERVRGTTEEELRPRLRAEAFRPFELTGEPLLRVRIYETAADRHILLLVIHHIIADFTSIAILLRELDRLYLQETGGPPAALPPLSCGYIDYVRWQERYLASEAGEESWRYWRERLAGELPLLAVPTDRPRPPVLSDRGDSLSCRLRPGVVGRLNELAQGHGATLFTVLLAAFQTLLHRHSGQLDLLLGSPAAGRTHFRFADVMGYFVQPVVLRADFTGDPTVTELLLRTRDAVAGALDHQEFPLPLLAERLQPERSASHSSLFQAQFVLHRGNPADGRLAGMADLALGVEGARIEIGELQLESLPLGEIRTQFDLTLAAAETGDGLLLALQYSRDLFDASSIVRMLQHLEVVLAALGEDGSRSVRDLPLLTAAERRQLLDRNAAEPAPDRRLHELFEEQVARTPDAVALVAGAARLTYSALDQRSNRLARRLRASGVRPESTVGVCLERSADLVTALLAVMKAGGAYLPLDPTYPGERLGVLLEDAGADVLITREPLLERLPHRPQRIMKLDTEEQLLATESGARLPAASLPDNLAYLIYTSGSTGRPKGVAISHRNAVALVRWARQVFADRELAGVLAATSIGFDLSIFELFVPLAWGGRVILADNALGLAQLAAAAEVTLVNTVPSAIAELIERAALPPEGVTVNLAGEALAGTLVQRLHDQPAVRRLLNLYGPSETTTYSTFAVLPPGRQGSPPIGHPVAGTRVYLLDAWLRLVPCGATGELYIGGEGVSRGYYRRPDLTAERFVPDPFSPPAGERLYRTGDLARRRPDGELEFLGRRDHQVKIRGFRIELGEIESALESHPQIRQAVVLARDVAPGDRRLLAYLVFTAEPVPAAQLRSFLKRTLPDPMIPAVFVAMESFPLTPHGKVDRKVLPAPAWEAERRGGAAPRGEIEELVAGIWADVLGLARVSVEDNFFDLGGHSLLASRVLARVEGALGVALPLSTLFQTPTVAALAARIAELDLTEPLPPLGVSPRVDPLPLSFAQQRLWFLHQMEPESAAYNVAGALRLSGPLREDALEAALRELVRRHESLRTAFPSVAGEPRQEIAPAVGFALTRIDLASLPAPARSATAVLQAEAGRPFELAPPPLLRACLLRLAAEDRTLLLTTHHIVSDGLSLQILFRELAALYAAAVDGVPSPLPPPPQYADFVLWQRGVLTGSRLERLLGYWRERLAGTPALELPTDRPRPAVSLPRGGRRQIEAPGSLTDRLRKVSRSLGVTPFMTLLGGFSALFSRYSGQEDFALGSPVATRSRIETEGMVGILVNTLVLRADLSGSIAARTLLWRLREAVLGAHAHQDLPFERLVEELQPERTLDRTPLFQVMVAFFSAAEETAGFRDLRAELLEVDNGTAKFDLTALLREERERLHLALVYRLDLFEAVTVERLGRHLLRLLEGMAADPEMRISELPLLTEIEAHQLASEWNPPSCEGPRDRTVHGLFEEQAARTPDRPAVVCRGERLTYLELDRRASALAHALRRLGVGPEVLVGLCVHRSVEAVVGILGVLKAGGAYLPLDPEYPPERLTFMLEDSRARVLLTQEPLLPRLHAGAARTFLLDRLPEVSAEAATPPAPAAGPENLAYVIYTSGSTGRPKGTLIEHRSVVNLAQALRAVVYEGRQEPLRVSVNASLAFDASVKQIVQLVHGHTLHIVPDEVRRDGEALVHYLRQQPLDVLDCTPSQLGLLLASGLLDSGEISPAMALVGGEPIGEALWRKLAESRRTTFHNVYGPTECTVDAASCSIRAGRDPALGRPIANVQIRLLDGGLQAVPAGVAGELCIAGAGLARGYLNRPALTAERFVPDAASRQPGSRIYRTGDLGRYLPDGRIEYLGRADHQVKVRGLRVELGEIEARLELHPGIERAVAVLRRESSDDQRLTAYFTGRAGLTDGELRHFLRQGLPDAMIPSAFVRLEALPLSAHGKIDRRSLPAPSAALEREFVAPRSALEASLARIWGELLRLERVGIRDNFFELGGHSLLALQLAARIREVLGVEAPVRVLFEHPTIEELAPFLAPGAAPRPAAPEALASPVRRGGRNLAQLLAEVGRLSPEEARRRLAEGEERRS